METSSRLRQRNPSRAQASTADTLTGRDDNHIVCAVSEARGISPTVGLSFVNLSTSEAVLCQLADTQTFARTCQKIKVFSPSEIVFASTAPDSKLIQIIRENLDVENNGIKMTEVDRRRWSEEAGHEYIKHLAFPHHLESLRLSAIGSYFANCCFGAVMKHINLTIGVVIEPQSLRIRFEPSEGALLIDVFTITSLELVQNVLDPKSQDCLFGLLNKTRTRMGMRMLKNNVLQPSTNKAKISGRYQAVAELTHKEEMFFAVRDALQDFVDLDKVLATLVIVQNNKQFHTMEHSVNTVIMLKTLLDMVMPLWQALAESNCEELLAIQQLLRPEAYASVKQLLSYALNDDVRYSAKPTEMRNQRVWALNAGVNGYLDAARQTYKEIEEDIYDLAGKLADQYQLNIELKFDPARHFFLKIKSTDLDITDLPALFVNVHKTKYAIECQTMDLLKFNQRLKDAHNEVIVLSDESIQELIRNIRPLIHPLFKISEGVALLDMLCSFAQLATTHNYVEPELTNTLAIQAGRHPIKEQIQKERYVPNDVYATPQSRFQIITGCNMSGKSTYIRSIALTTIMAQIGCFVPAKYASFPIVHQLFARTSTDDSIEANVSTFASEMREIASILHNIEPRSLVIVDELGRGTSTADGLCIAIAIAEALIESRALVWFVTHFRDLPRILAERAGVVNLHLAVDIAPDFSSMKMNYEISAGMEEQKYYGLALAKLVNLPGQILETAAQISHRLNKRNELRKENSQTLAIARKRKLVLKLKEQLLQARESQMEQKSLHRWLKQLQQEFVVRMSAIDAETRSQSIC